MGTPPIAVEGCHVTAQQGLQVLMQDEAGARGAGNDRAPSRKARRSCVMPGSSSNASDEAGEVDLGLLAWTGSRSGPRRALVRPLGRIAATKRFTAV